MAKGFALIKHNCQVIRALLLKDSQKDTGESINAGSWLTTAGLKSIGAGAACREGIIRSVCQSVTVQKIQNGGHNKILYSIE
jgi:hypothetical protein